jgi:hypothetical protein
MKAFGRLSLRSLICGIAAMLVIGAAAPRINAQTFNLADDWSNTLNPNGVWSFGESPTQGGLVTLYTVLGSHPSGLVEWIRAIGTPPAVTYNPTATPIVISTVRWEPGETSFHPGPSNERSVVRFTAPSAGGYDVSATFSGGDFIGPTTSDVHVLINGLEVFGTQINGFGPPSAKSYSASCTLSAGDTVEFVVGVGANGTYFYDTTILSVTITAANQWPDYGGQPIADRNR